MRRLPGTGRRTVCSIENIEQVETLVLSQEGTSADSWNTDRDFKRVDIAQSSINRVVMEDLRLVCFKKRKAQELTDANKKARLDRAQQLLYGNPPGMENLLWSTDEKVFTISSPRNPQIDRMYAAVGSRYEKEKRRSSTIMEDSSNFKEIMHVIRQRVFLGLNICTFCEQKVKVNGEYYRDVILQHGLLPAIREFSEYHVFFQQDGARQPCP